MRPHHLGAYLADPEGIPALMPQAQRLLELRRVFSELLPDALARSCSIANYKQGKIVVFAENSAIAAKVKLLRPQLIDRLSKCGVEVTGMDIGVQPPEKTVFYREKSAKLSATASAALDKLSGQVTDEKMKSCLRRMARRAQEPDAKAK
jgi:hypothetical protein